MKVKRITSFVLLFTLIVAVGFVVSGNINDAPYRTLNVRYDSKTEYLEDLTVDNKSKYDIEENVASKLFISLDEDLTSTDISRFIIDLDIDPVKIVEMDNVVNGSNIVVTDYEIESMIKQFITDLDEFTYMNGNNITYELVREYRNTSVAVVVDIEPKDVFAIAQFNNVRGIYKEVETFTSEIPYENTNAPIADDMVFDDAFYMNGQYAEYDINGIHETGLTGEGINVVVVDTGIDYYHPEFYTDGNPFMPNGETYKLSYDEETETFSCADDTCIFKGGYDFMDDDGDPMEATYEEWKAKADLLGAANVPEIQGGLYYTSHGTHVSGTIAGSGRNWMFEEAHPTVGENFGGFVGVAPDVNLYVFRVLGEYGRGNNVAIMDAIEHLTKFEQNGQPVQFDIANLSLGVAVNDALNYASILVENATRLGVLCVVSAGNNGPTQGTLGSPGSGIYSLTVGASDAPRYFDSYETVLGTDTVTYHEFGRTLDQYINDDISSLTDANNFVFLGYGLEDDFFDLNGPNEDVLKAITGNENAVWNNEEAKVEEASILSDTVVIFRRGFDAFESKMARAKAFGAKAVIFINHTTDLEDDDYDPSEYMENMYAEYALDIFTLQTSENQGNILLNYLEVNGNFIRTGSESLDFYQLTIPQNTFTVGSPVVWTTNDRLAAFSSRGPSGTLFDAKPNIVAPGTSVLSAVHSDEYNAGGRRYLYNEDGSIATDEDGTKLYDLENYTHSYGRKGGTSMSAPTVSGYAALLIQRSRDLGKDFDAITLRNIIMTSANESQYSIDEYCDPETDLVWTDNVPVCNESYNPFEMGPGLIDPYQLLGYNPDATTIETRLDDSLLAFNSLIKATSMMETVDFVTDYYNPVTQPTPRIGGNISYGHVFSYDGIENAVEEVEVMIENFTDESIDYELNYHFVYTITNMTEFQSGEEDDFAEYRVESLSPIGEDDLADAKIEFVRNDGTIVSNGGTITVAPGNMVKIMVRLNVETDAGSGYYSGYVNINSVSESNTEQDYRLPFSFKYTERTLTLKENASTNFTTLWGESAPTALVYYDFDIPAEEMYIFVQDEDGNYIGFDRKYNVENQRENGGGALVLVGGNYHPFTQSYPVDTPYDELYEAEYYEYKAYLDNGLYFLDFVLQESPDVANHDEFANPDVYHSARHWVFIDNYGVDYEVTHYTHDDESVQNRSWIPVDDKDLFELSSDFEETIYFRGNFYSEGTEIITSYFQLKDEDQNTFMYQHLMENLYQIPVYNNLNNEFKVADQSHNYIKYQINGSPFGFFDFEESVEVTDLNNCHPREKELDLETCYEHINGPIYFYFDVSSDDVEIMGKGFWLFIKGFSASTSNGYWDQNQNMYFAMDDELYVTIETEDPYTEAGKINNFSVHLHNLDESRNNPDLITIETRFGNEYEIIDYKLSDELIEYCIGGGTFDNPDFDCYLEDIDDTIDTLTTIYRYQLRIIDTNYKPDDVFGPPKRGITGMDEISILDITVEHKEDKSNEVSVYTPYFVRYRNAGQAYEVEPSVLRYRDYLVNINQTTKFQTTNILEGYVSYLAEYTDIVGDNSEVYLLHPDYDNPDFETLYPTHQKRYDMTNTSFNQYQVHELPIDVIGEWKLIVKIDNYLDSYYSIPNFYRTYNKDGNIIEVGTYTTKTGLIHSRGGDLNNDEIIDMRDIALIESAIGNDSKVSDELDFNKDGVINTTDLQIALLNFGEYSYYYDEDFTIPERVDSYMGQTPISIAYKHQLYHIIDELEDIIEELNEEEANNNE